MCTLITLMPMPMPMPVPMPVAMPNAIHDRLMPMPVYHQPRPTMLSPAQSTTWGAMTGGHFQGGNFNFVNLVRLIVSQKPARHEQATRQVQGRDLVCAGGVRPGKM